MAHSFFQTLHMLTIAAMLFICPSSSRAEFQPVASPQHSQVDPKDTSPSPFVHEKVILEGHQGAPTADENSPVGRRLRELRQQNDLLQANSQPKSTIQVQSLKKIPNNARLPKSVVRTVENHIESDFDDVGQQRFKGSSRKMLLASNFNAPDTYPLVPDQPVLLDIAARYQSNDEWHPQLNSTNIFVVQQTKASKTAENASGFIWKERENTKQLQKKLKALKYTNMTVDPDDYAPAQIAVKYASNKLKNNDAVKLVVTCTMYDYLAIPVETRTVQFYDMPGKQGSLQLSVGPIQASYIMACQMHGEDEDGLQTILSATNMMDAEQNRACVFSYADMMAANSLYGASGGLQCSSGVASLVFQCQKCGQLDPNSSGAQQYAGEWVQNLVLSVLLIAVFVVAVGGGAYYFLKAEVMQIPMTHAPRQNSVGSWIAACYKKSTYYDFNTHSHHSSGSSEIATPAFYIASTPAAHQAGAHTSPFAPVQVINYGENSTPRAGFSRGGLALGRLINGGARAGDEVERDSLLKPNGRGEPVAEQAYNTNPNLRYRISSTDGSARVSRTTIGPSSTQVRYRSGTFKG